MNKTIKIGLLCITVVSGGGCGPIVSSEQSLNGVKFQMEKRVVDPEQFKVNPESYPRFRVRHTIQPPPVELSIEMLEISEDDIWEVAYKFGDLYLIFSQSYTDRQCVRLAKGREPGPSIAHISPFTGKCRSWYRYCIYVDMTGTITAGWQLINNPDVKSSRSARSQLINPIFSNGGAWGIQPTFVRVN